MLQHIGCCESKWARYTHEFIYHRFMFFPPDVPSSPFSVRAVFFYSAASFTFLLASKSKTDFIDTSCCDSIDECVLECSLCCCFGCRCCRRHRRFFSFCSFHFLSHSMCVCASMIHILCNKTACPATYCTYGYQFNLTSGALSHFTQNNSGKKWFHSWII